MDLNLDEVGREMRLSIEVRNRQHLKRKFKNCFVGAEAVSWLLSASYAATRQEAVSIGKNLITKKLIRHVTDGHSFKDAFLYYRFTLDDPGVANLHTVCAGRGRYSISKVRIADMAQAQTQAQANQPSLPQTNSKSILLVLLLRTPLNLLTRQRTALLSFRHTQVSPN